MSKNRISSLFFCTVLGAGFATGQEILRYFMDYGAIGFLGIVISGVLFGYCVYRAMVFDSMEELLETLPRGFEYAVFLFFIVLYSAMLSSMGEILFTVFGLNRLWGSLGTMAISMILIYLGVERITDFSAIICYPMVAITLLSGLYILGENITPSLPTPNLKGIFTPIIYVSYNLITAVAIVMPYKYERGVAQRVGTLIALTALGVALPLYKYYGHIKNEALPILALMPSGSLMTYLYICVVICAIFSTAISNGYGATEMALKKVDTTRFMAVFVIGAVALILSLVGFENIVSKIYFVFGIIGFAMLYKIIKK